MSPDKWSIWIGCLSSRVYQTYTNHFNVFRFSENFSSSDEFAQYCTCTPKCNRLGFTTKMTWSPFSEIFNYATVYTMPKINHDLQEIRRVMDFQYLFLRNPEYTTNISNIDISMSKIYQIITVVLTGNIDNLNNVLNRTYGDATKNSTSYCLKTLDGRNTELVEYFTTSYFLKNDGYNFDYIVDDFGARLAHDVLHDWRHMDPFIQTINDSLTELYELVQNNLTNCLQNTNNSSDYQSIISDINVNIFKCLSSLEYIDAVHGALYTMVRADGVFADTTANWKGGSIDSAYTR